MPRLGDLERSVMEILWDAPAPVTAKAICQSLNDRGAADPSASVPSTLAVTTVLTVLSRLEKKGMVSRSRDERAHTYVPAATREDHVAELMREALGTAGDRDAALARFVGAASPRDADVLRRALRALGR